MGLFGRFNKANRGGSSGESGPSGYEQQQTPPAYNRDASLGAVQQAEQAKRETERQEDKLICAFMVNPQAGLFSSHSVQVGQGEREQFYRQVNDGQITPASESSMLRMIRPPALMSPEAPQQVLSGMQDKHERRILAYMSGTGFNHWQETSTADLSTALDKFPTPVEFAAAEQSLLQNIKDNNPPQKYREYQEAMESFKQKFYGKRYEYHKAFQSLRGKAEQFARTEGARANVLKTLHKDDTELIDDTELMDTPTAQPEQRVARAERPLEPPAQVEYLTKKEIKNFMKKGKIEGDEYLVNGNPNQAYKLNMATLEGLGLSPEYGVKFSGAEIGLSKAFEIGGGRTAVIAYVKTKDERGKDQVKVCSYYRSNSQGMWRYLPDYSIRKEAHEQPRGMAWYGKGQGEESLTLPMETQYALDVVNSQEHVQGLDPLNAQFAFAGTAKRHENWRDDYDYRLRKNPPDMKSDFYKEVHQAPSQLQHDDWQLGRQGRIQLPPEQLEVQGGRAPDLSQLEHSYQKNAGMNGNVRIDYFRSKDGQYRYSINQDARGRAWLGGVEKISAPLSSAGLRTEWISVGNFSTPLYEYKSQTEGFGDPQDTPPGHYEYQCMWKNYLSRVPLLKNYINRYGPGSRQR